MCRPEEWKGGRAGGAGAAQGRGRVAPPNPLGAACAVDGLTEDEYRSTVLQPFGKEAAVYLANNDFLAQQSTYFEGDWAQESLLQCEQALYRLGVKRPPWHNASYYAERLVAKAW